MSVFIEDSPRNLDRWIVESARAGTCTGAVISPFATPWEHQPGPGRKRAAAHRVTNLQDDGVEVWLDPLTHALQMSGVGDFRYYDQWPLWSPGRRGRLETPEDRADHVGRVFTVQSEMGVRRLAPTILLHTGLSDNSTRALELTREATTQQPGCWVTVAGSSSFWNSEAALDAHLGALAALDPGGWVLVSVKSLTTWPVEIDAGETHGLCRAARALGEDAPVHISHGDLAALPAVVAGAATVGSGWDKRQRVCSAADYAPRPDTEGGGSWLQRVTLRGLLGAVSANEADVLRARDPELTFALGGLPAAPEAQARFAHHLDVLTGLVDDIVAIPDHAARYQHLAASYRDATDNWARVQAITRCSPGADAWIEGLNAGLGRYAATEGFPTV